MSLTPNYQLELPGRGEYAGRWDIPVNSNFALIDSILKDLLINQAGPTQPSSAKLGQLWFDTVADKLKLRKPSGFHELVDNENLFVLIGGEPVIKNATPPSIPGNIVARKYIEFGSVNFGVIEVWWDESPDSDFASFIISIQRPGDDTTSEFITTQPYYKFDRLIPDNVRPYVITLKAINKQGYSSPYSVPINVTLTDNLNPPGDPSVVTVVGGIKKLIVKFLPPNNKDLVGFEVHTSETSNFEPQCGQPLWVGAPIPDAPAPNSSETLKYRGTDSVITIPAEKSNTTYYVKIRAWNTSGHFSGFSSQAYATTSQIDTEDIAPMAIDSALIAEAAITSAHISEVDAGLIKSGVIDADRIAAESITSKHIYGGGSLADVGAYRAFTYSNGILENGGPTTRPANTIGIWKLVSAQTPASFTVDLTGDNDVTVGEIAEISFSSLPSTDTAGIPKHYKIAYSSDAFMWTDIVEITNNATSPVSEKCPYISARYIRLVVFEGQTAESVITIGKLEIKARQGGTLITGEGIKTGSIKAEHLDVADLSAISADMGSITAGTIDMSSSHSWIKSGMPSFATGTGFWLGRDEDGIPKMSIGDAQTNTGITWDGETLKIGGNVLIGDSGIRIEDITSGAYNVTIESTNGGVFKPGQIMSTYLIAHVFHGDMEITDQIPASRFRWRRVSFYPQSPPYDDATWNAQYSTGFKQILITTDTVESRATFHCDILRD